MASSSTFDVAIAGAGPAGTSAAIHLAMGGARVLLIEEKKFPRAKLCGEFISPECLAHFKRLGVDEQMLAARGVSIAETVFFSRRGRSVAVPSEWFKAGTAALGLSRSEMDYRLLERAKSAGVKVLEEAHACGLIRDAGYVRGIRVKSGEVITDYRAQVSIDATGRTRTLARHLEREKPGNKTRSRATLVAFKAHLENVHLSPGACEIYFYPGGYGGLSAVEDGLSNLCFITSAPDVRHFGSDPEIVRREVVMKNARAQYTLAHARARTAWLSVSLERFGRGRPTPAVGLLTIGDAAAFIDPFTGSGMLMALESGEVAAKTISNNLASLGKRDVLESVAAAYTAEYSKRFRSRLRIAGLLRRAAFVPPLVEASVVLFGASARLRYKLARATRRSAGEKAEASLS